MKDTSRSIMGNVGSSVFGLKVDYSLSNFMRRLTETQIQIQDLVSSWNAEKCGCSYPRIHDKYWYPGY